VHVGDDAVHVARRIRAQVEDGDLLLLVVASLYPRDVVLQGVGSKDGHLARAVCLYVLPRL
jgi:hypothetical protein